MDNIISFEAFIVYKMFDITLFGMIYDESCDSISLKFYIRFSHFVEFVSFIV